jgi:hypothetical protein
MLGDHRDHPLGDVLIGGFRFVIDREPVAVGPFEVEGDGVEIGGPARLLDVQPVCVRGPSG